MKRLLTSAAVLLLLAGASQASPTLVAMTGDAAPPVIDGRVLDEPVWQLKGLRAVLSLNGTGQPPRQATRCGVLYDATSLYVAFVCDAAQPVALKATPGPRDADLTGQEVVEFFLAASGEESPWYRFTVSAAGVLADAMAWDRSYNTAAVAAAARTATGWSAELRIPLIDLRPDLAVQDTWRVNFLRRDQATGELSSWAPWSDELVAVSRFGELVEVRANWPEVVRQSLWRRALSLQRQATALQRKARPLAGFALANIVLAGTGETLREVATLGRIGRAKQPPVEELALGTALATRLEQRLLRLGVLGSRLELLRQSAGPEFALCRVSGEGQGLSAPTLEPLQRLELALPAGSQHVVSLLVVPLAGTLRDLAVRIENTGPNGLVAACQADLGAEVVKVPLTGVQGYRLQIEAPPAMAPGRYDATLVVSTTRHAVRLPLGVQVH